MPKSMFNIVQGARDLDSKLRYGNCPFPHLELELEQAVYPYVCWAAIYCIYRIYLSSYPDIRARTGWTSLPMRLTSPIIARAQRKGRVCMILTRKASGRNSKLGKQASRRMERISQWYGMMRSEAQWGSQAHGGKQRGNSRQSKPASNKLNC